MHNVDKTAILEGNIEIHPSAYVGPYCILKGNIKIGANTKLLGHVVMQGDIEIGEGNTFYYFCSIGTEPQDAKFKNEGSYIKIGNNNVIREYVTINGGTEKGNSFAGVKNVTSIANNCYLMISSHIAHDVVLDDNVTITNGAGIAGHVKIDRNTIIGGMTGIHQGVHIGAYCMVSGMCGVARSIPPYSLAFGTPAEVLGLNIVGLKRAGFSLEEIKLITEIFDILANGSINLAERLSQIKQNQALSSSHHAEYILSFIENLNSRGICDFKK